MIENEPARSRWTSSIPNACRCILSSASLSSTTTSTPASRSLTASARPARLGASQIRISIGIVNISLEFKINKFNLFGEKKNGNSKK